MKVPLVHPFKIAVHVGQLPQSRIADCEVERNVGNTRKCVDFNLPLVDSFEIAVRVGEERY